MPKNGLGPRSKSANLRPVSILERARSHVGGIVLALLVILVLGWSPAKRAWILMKGVPVEARIENVTCGTFSLGCTAWFTYTGSDGKTTRGLSTVFKRERPAAAQARYLPGHERDMTTAAELVDDDGHAWASVMLGVAFALYVLFKGRWRYREQ